MASYRPFPPQPSLPPPPLPNQNPLPPQPHQQHYPQSSSFPQNFNQMSYQHQPQHYPSSRPQHPPPTQQQYSYPPPPPPPESSYPPPPPPPVNSLNSQPPMYYPSSQYSSQYSNQPMQSLQQPPPPPPPSSPPPGSSIPPPPPPSSPPPPPPKESILDKGLSDRNRGVNREVSRSGRHEYGHADPAISAKQHRVPVPPVKKPSGQVGRVETDEERRLRKKRDFEKQRQEEKHRHQMKESQDNVLHRTQVMSSGKGHGSIVGSRMGDRRATPLLTAERIENRLKKPTTFLCKLKFRNELPDPSAQPKLMALKRDKDRFTKYTITSLEKAYKPQLFVEPDLGIPLDLLDLSVYNPPSTRPALAPEDEELLRDDEAVTPVKKDGIRRKERPTDKGVSWLVKTQYISPLSMDSMKQSLTEKQAKELREMKGGRNILENLNDRERQIKEIEASFEAAKLRPVHAENKKLEPVEIIPLFPDFIRNKDQYVQVTFDSAPTADSEVYGKLNSDDRDAYEARAIMKSFVAPGADPDNPEKFLSYMAPSVDEVDLSKDIYDEHEDISYSWVREYHWDVRGDDADDPTTYFLSFDDGESRYVPVPTKLNLRKRRAREGRSGDEVEHFPIPSQITVRNRPAASVTELKESGVYSSSRGGFSNSKMARLDTEDGLGRLHRVGRHEDVDQYSEPEDDMSD